MDVQTALDDIYTVFSLYSPKDLDPSWQAFWHPTELAALERLPVQELSEDLLGVVLGNVVTLSGGMQDLKYFLPRLLEVAIQHPSREDLTSVLSIADQAGLRGWPNAERTSVHRFLHAWWRQCLEEPVSFNAWPVEDALCAAAFAFEDLSVLLADWIRDERLNATLHIMNTARVHLSDRNGDAHLELQPFWEQRPVQTAQVRAWLLSADVLERLREATEQVDEEEAHQLLQETTARLNQIAAK